MDQNNQQGAQGGAPVPPGEYEAPAGYGQSVGNGAQNSSYAQAAPQTPPYAEPYIELYPHSSNDKTLFKVAFAFQVVTTVCCAWTIIALAWMIPMCVIGYKMMKGQKANTVAWGVCNLIFMGLVSGILYLVAEKDEKRY